MFKGQLTRYRKPRFWEWQKSYNHMSRLLLRLFYWDCFFFLLRLFNALKATWLDQTHSYLVSPMPEPGTPISQHLALKSPSAPLPGALLKWQLWGSSEQQRPQPSHPSFHPLETEISKRVLTDKDSSHSLPWDKPLRVKYLLFLYSNLSNSSLGLGKSWFKKNFFYANA